MMSAFEHFKAWTGIDATNMELLYYILIGFAWGLVLRGSKASFFISLVVGAFGALLGGIFLDWADLFPYAQYAGASVWAIFFLVLNLPANSFRFPIPTASNIAKRSGNSSPNIF